jgi:hypothetical protein
MIVSFRLPALSHVLAMTISDVDVVLRRIVKQLGEPPPWQKWR